MSPWRRDRSVPPRSSSISRCRLTTGSGPMASDRRRPLILLGALVALILVWNWMRQPDSTPAASGGGVARAVPINPGGTIAEVPDVKLEALKAAHTELAERGRNPFRVQPKASPPDEAPSA